MTLAADDPRHGTVNAYNNHRCRCDECRVAATAYRTARLDHRAHGVARRRMATWAVAQHPDIYRQLFDEALAELEPTT